MMNCNIFAERFLLEDSFWPGLGVSAPLPPQMEARERKKKGLKEPDIMNKKILSKDGSSIITVILDGNGDAYLGISIQHTPKKWRTSTVSLHDVDIGWLFLLTSGKTPSYGIKRKGELFAIARDDGLEITIDDKVRFLNDGECALFHKVLQELLHHKVPVETRKNNTKREDKLWTQEKEDHHFTHLKT